MVLICPAAMLPLSQTCCFGPQSCAQSCTHTILESVSMLRPLDSLANHDLELDPPLPAIKREKKESIKS